MRALRWCSRRGLLRHVPDCGLELGRSRVDDSCGAPSRTGHRSGADRSLPLAGNTSPAEEEARMSIDLDATLLTTHSDTENAAPPGRRPTTSTRCARSSTTANRKPEKPPPSQPQYSHSSPALTTGAARRSYSVPTSPVGARASAVVPVLGCCSAGQDRTKTGAAPGPFLALGRVTERGYGRAQRAACPHQAFHRSVSLEQFLHLTGEISCKIAVRAQHGPCGRAGTSDKVEHVHNRRRSSVRRARRCRAIQTPWRTQLSLQQIGRIGSCST